MILGLFWQCFWEKINKRRGWNRSHAGYRLCAQRGCDARLAALIGLLLHGVNEVLDSALRLDRTAVRRREWGGSMCITKRRPSMASALPPGEDWGKAPVCVCK